MIAATADRPATTCHVYVIDAGGDERLDELAALAHCGAVVRPHERERLSRLLRRLAGEVAARRAAGDGADRPAIVLAVDRMPVLRSLLDDPLDHRDLDLLHQVVTEGPAAGVATIMTAERPAALPGSVLATCSGRWVGRLDDATEASACGVPASLVPAGGCGRFVVAGSRLVAQVADLAVPSGGGGPGGPPPVDALEVIVTMTPTGRTGGGETLLTVGVDFDSLAPAVLAVPDGEHVLVAGPARQWAHDGARRAGGGVARRPSRPTGVARRHRGEQRTVGRSVVDLDVALTAVNDLDPGAAGLLAIDDAERIDDPRLGPLAAERRPGLLIVAAGRPDALRTLYGHWTTVVRRSRLGVLLAACADVDGDVLGELLPRRPPIPARPGLAWLADASGRRLAQLTVVSRPSPSPAVAAR